MDSLGIHAFRSSRRHAQRPFIHAGGIESHDRGSRIVTTGRLRFENPAYSTFDASFGVAKDAWYVSVFGENLADSNASTFVSTDQFIVAQTPLRPRVLGLTFGYKF